MGEGERGGEVKGEGREGERGREGEGENSSEAERSETKCTSYHELSSRTNYSCNLCMHYHSQTELHTQNKDIMCHRWLCCHGNNSNTKWHKPCLALVCRVAAHSPWLP